MNAHPNGGNGTAVRALTRKDFQSPIDVRWCPGCGDYAILSQVQKTLADLGVRRENVVFISGIGCSSRFPYYMNTYGFHTIHGRAPGIATGLKLSRPDLEVWIVTGDGDALSIGGNHFIHTLRRNVDVKILLFNNRIYGLTKGQASPTSDRGTHGKSTPYGSVDRPFNPIQLALGSGGSFVARGVDIEIEQMQKTLQRMAAHKGTAFLEIFQNCVVFNDGCFNELSDRSTRDDAQLRLEHGKPLLFGKDKKRGIRLRAGAPEVVTIGENGVTAEDILVWDERAPASLAFALAELGAPTPLGIFRAVDEPVHHVLEHDLEDKVTAAQGPGELSTLLEAGDTWTV